MPEPETTQILLTAINNLDTKLDGIKESMTTISGRVGALEIHRQESQKTAERFLNQTWPSHEKVVELLEERVRIVEQEKVTWNKLEDLEHRVREIEPLKDVQDKVQELDKAMATANVKLAFIIGMASIAGSGLVTLVFKALGH